jgi:hypothetical protein
MTRDTHDGLLAGSRLCKLSNRHKRFDATRDERRLQGNVSPYRRQTVRRPWAPAPLITHSTQLQPSACWTQAHARCHRTTPLASLGKRSFPHSGHMETNSDTRGEDGGAGGKAYKPGFSHGTAPRSVQIIPSNGSPWTATTPAHLADIALPDSQLASKCAPGEFRLWLRSPQSDKLLDNHSLILTAPDLYCAACPGPGHIRTSLLACSVGHVVAVTGTTSAPWRSRAPRFAESHDLILAGISVTQVPLPVFRGARPARRG